ncbi:hypothetical protein HO173_007681 [Letharia columbiana]|uniref:Uncharacterized protein n=1 Tax=Letharia columbiana TaxID=112416 RepID=A0A8H6L3M5_9LECA|nr:uncharacterized protein HO173_007681 [Letharia columbiana]KAF6234259.1 hypothetical protein HO173_007681 [Letharia columbiana]
MPPQMPDCPRQSPASIDPATDMCRKWTLWGRGDYLDSVICCKVFPDRHSMDDADVARALSILHKQCANMTGPDAAELWRFLETHPDLHTNGLVGWRKIKDGGPMDKVEEAKVNQAINRFKNQVPSAGKP